MFHVIEVDGFIKACICTNNKADKYGTPKEFKSRKDAEKWIDKHSCKGMLVRYEVKEI